MLRAINDAARHPHKPARGAERPGPRTIPAAPPTLRPRPLPLTVRSAPQRAGAYLHSIRWISRSTVVTPPALIVR
jgi:hypothetical protein